MEPFITGLHHVTALTSDAQKNVDFYTGVLGLRLVKKTVNFDAPDVYHFYYGDRTGQPGSILTFFPYSGLTRGRKGKGQVTVTSFSVPEDSFGYWMKRFHKLRVPFKEPQERFDEAFIYFEDNDGLGLELVASGNDPREGYDGYAVPGKHAIKGFHSVALTLEGYEKTAALLTQYMDFRKSAEAGSRFRFSAGHGQSGTLVDIICSPDTMRGLSGSGTVHHVAFAAMSDAEQLTARQKLINAGYDVTPVIDRQYFHSVYFREPGGVLFEIATSDIGFTLDEPVEHLGESLKLPRRVEHIRTEIENALPPVAVNVAKYAD